MLLRLGRTVEEEAAALADGNKVARPLAESLLAGELGNADETYHEIACAVGAAVEWDVEPDGAWERVESALGLDDG